MRGGGLTHRAFVVRTVGLSRGLHKRYFRNNRISTNESGDRKLFLWVSTPYRFLECYRESLCLS
jgi:hypothetical protein